MLALNLSSMHKNDSLFSAGRSASSGELSTKLDNLIDELVTSPSMVSQFFRYKKKKRYIIKFDKNSHLLFVPKLDLLDKLNSNYQLRNIMFYDNSLHKRQHTLPTLSITGPSNTDLLPNELIELIFRNLSPSDLAITGMVSMIFRSHTQKCSSWAKFCLTEFFYQSSPSKNDLEEINSDPMGYYYSCRNNSYKFDREIGEQMNIDEVTFMKIEGDKLICGYLHGGIKIWNLYSGYCDNLSGHKGMIKEIKLLDHYLVSCSTDGLIKVWDINKNTIHHEFTILNDSFTNFQIYNETLIATSALGIIYVWDLFSQELKAKFESNFPEGMDEFFILSNVKGDEKLIFGGLNGDIKIYDFATAKFGNLKSNDNLQWITVKANTLICAGNNFEGKEWIQTWNLKTLKIEEKFVFEWNIDPETEKFSMKDENNSLLSCQEILSTLSKKLFESTAKGAKICCFGSEIISIAGEGKIDVWNSRTFQHKQRLMSIEKPSQHNINWTLTAISGRMLAVSSPNKKITLWSKELKKTMEF